MQGSKSKIRGALAAGFVVLLWSGSSFAGTPLLGPDCGTGAAIVGSDSAGKVTIGAPEIGVPLTGTCTLSFSVSYTNPPACSATNETNGGNFPTPAGAKTTYTTLVLGSSAGWITGDIISYSCQGY
jgi:hypothetical protein